MCRHPPPPPSPSDFELAIRSSVGKINYPKIKPSKQACNCYARRDLSSGEISNVYPLNTIFMPTPKILFLICTPPTPFEYACTEIN